MIIEIRVPRIPELVEKSTIIQWTYQVGSHVTQGEVLVEIETEKLILEIIAPASGVLKEIKVAVGKNVSGNEVIGTIST